MEVFSERIGIEYRHFTALYEAFFTYLKVSFWAAIVSVVFILLNVIFW